MKLYNESNNGFERSHESPDISTTEFVKCLLNEIDTQLIESKGVVSSELPLPISISFAFVSPIELIQINSKMPNGIKLAKKKMNSKSERLVLKAYIDPGYALTRYRTVLYSEEFAQRIINHRNEELKKMCESIFAYYYFSVGKSGLLVADDDNDKYAIKFSSLNLKPLESIAQIHTLAKVLADALDQRDQSYIHKIHARSYYKCNYSHPYDVIQKVSITVDKHSKPPVHSQNTLSSW